MRATRWAGAAVVLAGAGWERIEAILRLSWRSLAAELRAAGPAR